MLQLRSLLRQTLATGYIMWWQADLPAGIEVRPTQMRPFMKVPVVSTAALHWKVMPKNVFTPAETPSFSFDYVTEDSACATVSVRRMAL